MSHINRIAIIAASLLTAISALPAVAQDAPAKGLKGHYIGAGPVVGIQVGDKIKGTDRTNVGGSVQGRYSLQGTAVQAPISLRGAVQFNKENVSIQPMVTYDMAIAPNVNLYAGGGGSILVNGKNSPMGTRSAAMLTAGLEGQVYKNTVLFGDVKWGINAAEKGRDVLGVQVGGAYKF
jgi:hypothetical protein